MNEALRQTEAAEAWLAAKAQAARESLPAPEANGSTPTSIVVLAEQGIGDTARAIAYCTGVHEYPVLVGHYDGTMAKRDMAHAAMRAGVIARYVEAPTPGGVRLSRERLIRACVATWQQPVLDAMCVVPRRYYEARWAQDICPLNAIYDGYPHDTWRLNYVDLPWWELATMAMGRTVTPSGLKHAVPTECAPWPDEADIPPGGSLAELKAKSGSADFNVTEFCDSRPYVTIHHGAGGGGANVKVTPRPILDAIVATLERKGINVVQVGRSGEAHLKCYAHRMDLRLPVTCALMKRAVAHIDNDSCLPYLAHGMGVKSAVFFGVTPFYVYGLPGNLNIPSTGACPMRSCFGGGQWGPYENWWRRCRCNAKDGCVNFPEPAQAAKVVTEWVESLL